MLKTDTAKCIPSCKPTDTWRGDPRQDAQLQPWEEWEAKPLRDCSSQFCLSRSSISAKFCSAKELFFLGWAEYILWLSPQEEFLQSLLWLFRHYCNMHLNCLMHEPTIKPLQSRSIKSLFQRLPKRCVWIKNWCCCWERLEIYLCFNVVTQCDCSGRIWGQKKILIMLWKWNSKHFTS